MLVAAFELVNDLRGCARSARIRHREITVIPGLAEETHTRTKRKDPPSSPLRRERACRAPNNFAHPVTRLQGNYSISTSTRPTPDTGRGFEQPLSYAPPGSGAFRSRPRARHGCYRFVPARQVREVLICTRREIRDTVHPCVSRPGRVRRL